LKEVQTTKGDVLAVYKSVSRSELAARLAYALSAHHCTNCRGYHSVWPYLRLIDPPRGVDSDRDQLMGVLAPHLHAGSTILLAGSADAGLAECVLDAAADRPVNLTVVDLCETPLRQSAELLGNRAAGRLFTRRASITGQAVAPPVDLIVAHSVLSFLAEGEISQAAAFINRSLLPTGRLVLTTSIGRRAPATDPASFRLHVLAQLAARDVRFPDGELAFTMLLDDYALGRARRASPFADRNALLQWLKTAGLSLESMQDLRRGTGFDSCGDPVPRVSEGVLVVARKGLAG
jgi:hypothetical protein